MVTENVADYTGEQDLVIVCVLKRNLPSGGAQANALATLLDRWGKNNPRPYLGQHWPVQQPAQPAGFAVGSRRMQHHLHTGSSTICASSCGDTHLSPNAVGSFAGT